MSRNCASDVEVDPETQVNVHPLTILNITDHFTRLNVRQKPRSLKEADHAIGALLGTQTNRRIEIFTSFELAFAKKGDHFEFDANTVKVKRDLLAKMFAQYDLLGWYVTGNTLTDGDIDDTHKAFLGLNESSLVMVVDTMPAKNAKTLPVYLYQTVTKLAGSTSSYSLERIRYSVESEESERVGVDMAMKVDMAAEKQPTLVPQAERIESSVSTLKGRIQVVLQYLIDVKQGNATPDFELLRRISELCNSIPCGGSSTFDAAFNKEYEDGLMVTYLGVLSKGSCIVNSMVDKTSVFSERRRPSGFGTFAMHGGLADH